ncbi:MAG TPA: hypothetical protein VF651_03935 [Gammaproteobacteria bacterium]
MDRKRLTTVLAAVGILAICGLVGLRLWANAQRNGMPQLDMVHVGPDGRIYAMLADTLYIEAPDGRFIRSIPLSRFGITGFFGDFAVLADGSLVLPASAQPADSLRKEVLIYQRIPTSGDEQPDAVPLTRCSLADYSCTPLTGGQGGRYFRADRTFKLAVDEAAGRIYVADTAAQRLLILDMQGSVLARQAGFDFPNQIELAGPGAVRVADTNDHALRRLTVRDDVFAGGSSQPVPGWPKTGSHCFPVGLAADRLGQQWALLTDNHIRNGWLYRVDVAGKPALLKLPEGSDVLFLAATADTVLAADRAHYAVHVYGLDGQARPDLGSGEFAAALSGFAAKRRLYDAAFDYSFVALLAALPLLLVALLIVQMQRGPAAGAEPLPGPSEGTPAVAWQGEQVFRRRVGGIVDARGRRRLLLLLSLALAAPVAIIVLVHAGLGRPNLVFGWHSVVTDPRLYVIVILALVLLVYALLCRRYERLILDRHGIRYVSWLGGPLAFLAPLQPAWQLRWEEVIDVRLVATARQAAQWYYELALRQGGTRRIGVFVWRDASQQDETGLGIRDLQARDPARFRQALAGTRLFAYLNLAKP